MYEEAEDVTDEPRPLAGDPDRLASLAEILAGEPTDQDFRGRRVDKFTNVADERALREVVRKHALCRRFDVAEEGGLEPCRVETDFDPADSGE